MDLMTFMISFSALLLSIILIWTIANIMIDKKNRLEAEERLIRELELIRNLRANRVSTPPQAGELYLKPQAAITLDKKYSKEMALAIRKLLMDDAAEEQGKAKDPREFTGRQKAALLLITMGQEFGIAMCKYLREDEIVILANETARPEFYDIEQQIAVLEEFHELMMVKNIKAGGINKTRKTFLNL